MPTTTRKPPRTRSRALSDDLRDILARRGPSYALGQEAGVAPSILTRFLAHERTMSLETLDKLAEVLGLRLVETSAGRRGGRKRADGPATSPADASESTPDPGPA